MKLVESQQHASLYGANIAIPVFIAVCAIIYKYLHLQISTHIYTYLHISAQVGAVLVLTLVILVVTKLCLTGGRWSKAPPATPPTPRLTQVDSRHASR